MRSRIIRIYFYHQKLRSREINRIPVCIWIEMGFRLKTEINLKWRECRGKYRIKHENVIWMKIERINNTKDVPTTQKLSQADWCIDFIRQTEAFPQRMTNGWWKSTDSQRGRHKVGGIAAKNSLTNWDRDLAQCKKLLTVKSADKCGN